MAYNCDAQDGNAADLLITNLNNGDSVAACGWHVGPFMAQMANAMGVEIPHPGVVTLDQLAQIGADREKEIDTIKASGPVLAGRKDELEYVLMRVMAIVSPPAPPEDEPVDEPAVWSDGNAVEAAVQGLDAVEVPDDTLNALGELRVDAGDPAPY
jgi:hypothetical protein